MAEDFMGNLYEEGDIVIYAAGSGRSITMVKAEVLAFNENGSVKLMPQESSRWKQHGSTYHVDSRTGKRIKNIYADQHVERSAFYRHKETGEEISSEAHYRLQCESYRHPEGYRNFNQSWEYHPYVFKDHVVQETKVTPVTITVTNNIVLYRKKDA